MYQCPSCGGNLQFDIKSQQLLCKYCNTTADPYSVEKEIDGYEQEWFDATYFLCPQCGGEVLTTDENMAAGFCSFCGASTILSSRISREKRPQAIIPFKISKEICKKLYYINVKKSIFAPKELKDEKYIESFRGIYMPYWKYKLTHRGKMVFKGEKSHRSGDYIITDHYDLQADVDASYDGFYYDGSSSFYDNISEPLAPFHMWDCQAFTPSFLSGFYADTADVDSEVYREDAIEEADNATFENVCSQFKEFSPDNSENRTKMKEDYGANCEKVDSIMFPVWFMVYRKKDRVAYATVNGQTGRVVADIPVDYTRYGIGSMLLSIPIFFLLNFLFTFRPSVILGIAMLLSLIVSLLYTVEVYDIQRKELNLDDKGIHGKRKVKKPNSNVSIKFLAPKWVLILVGAMFGLPILIGMLASGFLWAAALMGTIASAVIGWNVHKNISSAKGKFGFISTVLASIIGGIVSILNPVSDIYYYVSVLLIMIAIFVTIIDILRNYNVLTTRQLPQFNKQGGDDLA